MSAHLDLDDVASQSELAMKELKPCPFCGGEPYYTDASHTHAGVNMIICDKCGCRFYGATIEKWNTRTDDALRARVKDLEEALELTHKVYSTNTKLLDEKIRVREQAIRIAIDILRGENKNTWHLEDEMEYAVLALKGEV